MKKIQTIDEANRCFADVLGRLVDNTNGHLVGSDYPRTYLRVSYGVQPPRVLAVYPSLAEALNDYQRYADEEETTMEPVAYAYVIQQTLDRAEDEFGTGLSLAERERLADALEATITRVMDGTDTITPEGFAQAQAIKHQYLATWTLILDDETGSRRWIDTRQPLAKIALAGVRTLIPASPAGA